MTVPKLQQVGALSGHQNKVSCSSFSEDGKYLVSGSLDRRLLVWSTDSNTLILPFEGAHGSQINDVRFGSDTHCLSASSDKTVKLWQVAAPNAGCLQVTNRNR